MQIKNFTLTVLFSFFSIILLSSEQKHENTIALKHRSHSCPQGLLYRINEINDPLNEVLPIKYACSYKDPKQCYSPLRARLDEEQETTEEISNGILNCKEESSSESESDSEESACGKIFRDVESDQDVQSDEENLFEMDDIEACTSENL